MAQRDKKEETEIQYTETLTLTLCVNNCGLYGNPTTNNMCQSCFRSKIRQPSSPPSDSGKLRSDPIPPADPASAEAGGGDGIQRGVATSPQQARAAVSRCLRCRKRVGLAGFRCRCGELFCGDHRYSDRHECGFDYKKDGRERIQRENPVVRAAKIVRI